MQEKEKNPCQNLKNRSIIRLDFRPQFQEHLLAAVDRSRRRGRGRVQDGKKGPWTGDQPHNVENRQEKEVILGEYSGEEAEEAATAVLEMEVNPPAASGGGGFCDVRQVHARFTQCRYCAVQDRIFLLVCEGSVFLSV